MQKKRKAHKKWNISQEREKFHSIIKGILGKKDFLRILIKKKKKFDKK